MARTLLELVQDTSIELGITSPNAVTSSTDTSILQLRNLYNRLGADLIQEFEWRRATFIETFPTVDPVTTTGDTTVDSAVISNIPSTASLSVGMQVSGDGIPTNSLIESVDSATQITMDMVAESTGATTSISFYTQDFAMPSGFDRMISGTSWNRTNHWKNSGPKSAQEWQWLNGGSIASAPRFRYRLVGNKLRIFPAPTDVMNMAYEYVSTFWVIASGGSNPTKARTTADTDTCIFPDTLMAWGLRYYFEMANKLEFATSEGKFLDALSKSKAQDEDAPTLSLSRSRGSVLLDHESIPDSFPNIT
jgi:hypothetical protein